MGDQVFNGFGVRIAPDYMLLLFFSDSWSPNIIKNNLLKMANNFFINFSEAEKPDDLPILLGIDKNLFFDVIAQNKLNKSLSNKDTTSSSLNENKLFEHILIPKKKKTNPQQYRNVFRVENDALADAYKTFARRFELFASEINPEFPHSNSYGYTRGRNILENARNHCGAPLLLRADIVNFFPSISDKKLIQSFVKLGLNQEVSKALADFTTIDGSLPLGLHASPMLANLVCLDIDKKLVNLAKRYNCKYTRYADDITMSSFSELPSKSEISRILKEEDFILSDKKFRITKLGQSHFVTGLSVSDPSKPHIPKAIKRRLRQELFFCKKFGIKRHVKNEFIRKYILSVKENTKPITVIKRELEKEVFPSRDETIKEVNRIDGMIRYVSYIEESPYLNSEWSKLLIRDNLRPSYAPRNNLSKHIGIYIDEAEIDFDGKKILAISLMMTEDKDSIELMTSIALNTHIIDPFTTNIFRKKILKKEKLHYNAANEALKENFISLMTDFHFKGYIAYGNLKNYSNYQDLYLSLVRNILPDRLKKCDGSQVKLFFEENSKIKENSINNIVKEIYDDLLSNNDRRPVNPPQIISAKKSEHACLSVPDFLLGVFMKYAKIENLGHNLNANNFKKFEKIFHDEARFERLRDKYKLIIDIDSKLLFSRKRPFVPWKFANIIN